MTKEQINWKKLHPKGKAPLSWDETDYKIWNEEPPACLSVSGQTEGEAMDPDEVADFVTEAVQTISVTSEEYPEKAAELEADFWLDLEYLASLGKITEAEIKDLKKKDLFSFGTK